MSCEDSPENLMAANKPRHQAGSRAALHTGREEWNLGRSACPSSQLCPRWPHGRRASQGGRKVQFPEVRRKEQVQEQERSCFGEGTSVMPFPCGLYLLSGHPASPGPPLHPNCQGLSPEPPQKGTEPGLPATASSTRSLWFPRASLMAKTKPASPARKLRGVGRGGPTGQEEVCRGGRTAAGLLGHLPGYPLPTVPDCLCDGSVCTGARGQAFPSSGLRHLTP